MSNYFENLDEKIREYFSILSDGIPEFLYEYIDTAEMQKQAEISVSCGTFYSNIFQPMIWYSSLDHSVAVSLIIWNFTKDKKQTLAGLFHDISTPVFKHCIDFMNGDYEKQESTEELTTKVISNSKEIMRLLQRDEIKVEEVSDYHIYPIADNDTPMLSADRLEYTLSNGLGVRKKLWNLSEVNEIYKNIEIQKNEKGIDELGFKNKESAEKFVAGMKVLSASYITNETKLTMQLLADIIKMMVENNLITKKDLYNLSEKEVMARIEDCKLGNIKECFQVWKSATKVNESDVFVPNKYCVSINAKIRYIVPLVKHNGTYVRIDKISDMAKRDIGQALNFKTKRYAYLDCNL